MKIRLEVAVPGEPAYRWESSGSTIRIGRKPTCEIALQGHAAQVLSWEHALIQCKPEGAFLQDTGSTNGTYLESQRIGSPVRLEVGNEIRFGQSGPMVRVLAIENSQPAEDRRPVPAPVAPVAPAPKPSRPIGSQPASSTPQMASVNPLPGQEGKPATSTRMLLIGMQQRMQLWYLFAGAAVVVLVIAVLLVLEISLRRSEHVAAIGEEMYARILKSVVWIVRPIDPTTAATGSGGVVDAQRRLVVTNYHVVGDASQVQVYFPVYKDGKLIKEVDYYNSDKVTPHLGTVVARDQTRDIAILRLDELPDGVLPFTLGAAEAAQRVHTVGSPGVSQALWVYTTGYVKQVHPMSLDFADGLHVKATIVQTTAPINPGDSGGPLTNDAGELVAVNQSHRLDAQSVSHCIDASEVKAVLATVPP